MKATMDEQGVITIAPETGAEAFALKRWCDENYNPSFSEYRAESMERTKGMYRGNNLMVMCALPKGEA